MYVHTLQKQIIAPLDFTHPEVEKILFFSFFLVSRRVNKKNGFFFSFWMG